MFDWNVLWAILVIAGVMGVSFYVIPWLKKRNWDYYQEIEMALLICSYAFRNEKVHQISDIVLEVVKSVEELSINPWDKESEAISIISARLIDEFNIDIDDQTLQLLVRIGVSLLPPTNKE